MPEAAQQRHHLDEPLANQLDARLAVDLELRQG
jgi:hypothetical protein